MSFGSSWEKLLGNATAAVTAAIEIYNKPVFQYREECVVILLLNAWELALKALLSRNGQPVFRSDKQRTTLSWRDALSQAKPYFPNDVPFLPVERNLDLLGTYRNDVVHFYAADGFGVVVYALAQTSIKNLRDLMDGAFDLRLEDKLNWCLLPLGIRPPVDVATYIAGKSESKMTPEVRGFLEKMNESARALKKAGEDTARLLTVFDIKLESVKKIGEADVVIGVAKAGSQDSPVALIRTQDPNKSHPWRQKEVVERIGFIGERQFTSYDFQAITWKHRIKDNPQYCWKATVGGLTLYSHDVVAFVRNLSAAELEAARNQYRSFIRSRKKAK